MNPLKDTMSVLAQIVKLIPGKLIETLAGKHQIQTRVFSATSHVVALLYAQLAHSLSLNDLCDSLQNHHGTLNQIRNCTPPSRNGLSYANRTRNADLAEELFWTVLNVFKTEYPEFIAGSREYPGLPYRFRRRLYAFDSTTISLTASSISWAQHRRQKAAAKAHTGLNLQSFLPDFVIVKSAKDSDPKTAWELCGQLKSGEVAVFDKAYVDFKHLNHLHERGIFWVTRAKENMLYEVMGQQAFPPPQEEGTSPQKDMGQHDSLPRNIRRKAKGRKRKYSRKKIRILRDSRIKVTGTNTRDHYPQELRLVDAEVEVKNKMVHMSFITNNFEWSPNTICELYQARWGVEVFFKELKQTLQLADFMGQNENAIRWQIWTALLTYLLLRFIAWREHWRHTFHRLFTLIRGVLWNYFNLRSVILACDSMGRRHGVRIRGSPERSYQPCFDFG